MFDFTLHLAVYAIGFYVLLDMAIAMVVVIGGVFSPMMSRACGNHDSLAPSHGKRAEQLPKELNNLTL
jgi:hypothetical protein